MKLVRYISTIAFYLTRITAVGYILTVLHIVTSVVFNLNTLKHLPNNRFAICYPFTSEYFLLGSEYTAPYIIEMIVIILFYGVFFWLLGNVFTSFRQRRLFTMQGVHNLKLFYMINLTFAPALFILLIMYSSEDYPYIGMFIAHSIMGIFALFIAAIFEQGVNLQDDQDLII